VSGVSLVCQLSAVLLTESLSGESSYAPSVLYDGHQLLLLHSVLTSVLRDTLNYTNANAAKRLNRSCYKVRCNWTESSSIRVNFVSSALTVAAPATVSLCKSLKAL
jgi:hypothetical protein